MFNYMVKGGKTNKIHKNKTRDSKKISLTVKVKKTSKNKEKTVKKKIVPAQISKEKALSPEIEQITPREKEIVGQILSAKEESLKTKIMYSGVSFFMIVIILFWVYNTKQVIEQSKITNNNQFSSEGLKDLAKEFAGKMDEIKTDLEKINSFNASSSEISTNKLPESASTSINLNPDSNFQTENITTSSTTKPTVSEEEINMLKEKLKELEEKIDR